MDVTSIKPYLILNLGVEMLFVIQQRLRAQRINCEKANIVMNDICQALFSSQMINSMFQTAEDDLEMCTHKGMKSFLEHIVHSSIMQLDRYSMDRLFDLITMIFKWQITMSGNIVAITKKHIQEVKTLFETEHLLNLVENAENTLENNLQTLNANNIALIKQKLFNWLDIFKIRVSILLKLGLQNQDGIFIVNEYRNSKNDQIINALLTNIGSNIYTLTQDSKGLELSYEKKEIGSLVTQMQSSTKLEENYINLKLSSLYSNLESQSVDDSESNTKNTSPNASFSYLDLKCAPRNDSLAQIFQDMSFDKNNL